MRLGDAVEPAAWEELPRYVVPTIFTWGSELRARIEMCADANLSAPGISATPSNALCLVSRTYTLATPSRLAGGQVLKSNEKGISHSCHMDRQLDERD